MVEFIEVLHVAKDDVLLIDDSWRNLLNSTGHLPQVGLQCEKKTKPTKLFNRLSDTFPNFIIEHLTG